MRRYTRQARVGLAALFSSPCPAIAAGRALRLPHLQQLCAARRAFCRAPRRLLLTRPSAFADDFRCTLCCHPPTAARALPRLTALSPPSRGLQTTSRRGAFLLDSRRNDPSPPRRPLTHPFPPRSLRPKRNIRTAMAHDVAMYAIVQVCATRIPQCHTSHHSHLARRAFAERGARPGQARGDGEGAHGALPGALFMHSSGPPARRI